MARFTQHICSPAARKTTKAWEDRETRRPFPLTSAPTADLVVPAGVGPLATWVKGPKDVHKVATAAHQKRVEPLPVGHVLKGAALGSHRVGIGVVEPLPGAVDVSHHHHPPPGTPQRVDPHRDRGVKVELELPARLALTPVGEIHIKEHKGTVVWSGGQKRACER